MKINMRIDFIKVSYCLSLWRLLVFFLHARKAFSRFTSFVFPQPFIPFVVQINIC